MRYICLVVAAFSGPVTAMAQQPTAPASGSYQQMMDYVVAESNLFPHFAAYETVASPDHCVIVTTSGFLNPWVSKGMKEPVTYQVINLRYADPGNFSPVYSGINLQCKQAGCANAGTQYTYQEASWTLKNEALLRFPDGSLPAVLPVLSRLIDMCSRDGIAVAQRPADFDPLGRAPHDSRRLGYPDAVAGRLAIH